MFIFDAHCDTLSTKRPLWSNSGHVDIKRLRVRGPGVQVMAAFGKDQLGQLDRLIAATQTYNCALLPAIEGGDTIKSISDLTAFLNRKPVFFGLTWNGDNFLAGGCRGSGSGLTPLGRDVIKALESRNIFLDLAHIHPRSFWEALELSKKPVVVSHACCAALNPHPRNLTDEQMQALANSGGVLGITFYPPFITGKSRASFSDLTKHIEHAINIMGSEHVGLGSDFDGCDLLPDGISDVLDLPKYLDSLPFNSRITENIASRNFLKLLTDRA